MIEYDIQFHQDLRPCVEENNTHQSISQVIMIIKRENR